MKNRQNSDSNSPKNAPEDAEDEFVKSCVRVITEETDNTSNPVSARFSIPETYPYYEYQDYCQRERVRNRRAVSSEESGLFKIDLSLIEKDGRTTLMLRNIPNKYTRDMIVSEIDACNFKKKYDFFYLPIDYRVKLLIFRTSAMSATLSLILFTPSSFTSSIRNSITRGGKSSTQKRSARSVTPASRAPLSS